MSRRKYSPSQNVAYFGIAVSLNIILFVVLGSMMSLNGFAVLVAIAVSSRMVDIFGGQRCIMIWISTLLLSLIFVTSKSVFVMYLVCGYYPMVRPWLNKQHTFKRLICKMGLFLLSGAGMTSITILYKTLFMPAAEMQEAYYFAILMGVMISLYMVLLDYSFLDYSSEYLRRAIPS